MNLKTSDYKQFIQELKSKIQTSQIKASIKVNEELLKLYWQIAQMIVAKQKEASWGDNIIEKINRDLKIEFPDMKGFSLKDPYCFDFLTMGEKYSEKELEEALTKQIEK